MKVTPNTPGVSASLFDDGDAWVDYYPSYSDPVARVIEFPKVWRVNGKQYKVVRCEYRHNGEREDKVIARSPIGFVYIYDCDGTIESY